MAKAFLRGHTMKTSTPRGRRGFALAMTLIIVALVAIVTFTATSVSTLDTRTAMQEYQASRAYYAARAGLEAACINLAGMSTNGLGDFNWTGGNTTSGFQLVQGSSQELFTVSVTPAQWNNTTVSGKVWRVVSTGIIGNSTNGAAATRVLEAYLAPDSFAKYAYFTNAETTAGGALIRFGGGDKLTGPVHTNGFFTTSGNVQFTDKVTSANYGNDPFSPGSTWESQYNAVARTYNPINEDADGENLTDVKRFHRYDSGQSYSVSSPVAANITVGGNLVSSPNFSFAGGERAVQIPANMTDLTTANDTIQVVDAARNTALSGVAAPSPYNNRQNLPYRVEMDPATGKPSGFFRFNPTASGSPVPNGVTPPYDNTKWANITASNATEAPPLFNVQFTSTSSAGNATITKWNPAASGGGQFQPWNPTSPNGGFGPPTPTAIVIDTTTQPGVKINIDGLVVVNSTTTSAGAGLTNGLKGRVTLGVSRETHVLNSLTYRDRNDDVLGLMSRGDVVIDSPQGSSGDRTVHAQILSQTGSFRVEDHSTGGVRGTLNILGGIIQRTRGAVGTGTSSGLSNGFNKNYVYDSKLMYKPPLAFLPNGKVIINTIIDRGALSNQ